MFMSRLAIAIGNVAIGPFAKADKDLFNCSAGAVPFQPQQGEPIFALVEHVIVEFAVQLVREGVNLGLYLIGNQIASYSFLLKLKSRHLVATDSRVMIGAAYLEDLDRCRHLVANFRLDAVAGKLVLGVDAGRSVPVKDGVSLGVDRGWAAVCALVWIVEATLSRAAQEGLALAHVEPLLDQFANCVYSGLLHRAAVVVQEDNLFGELIESPQSLKRVSIWHFSVPIGANLSVAIANLLGSDGKG